MEIDLRALLGVGDRRTVGRVAEVVDWFEQSGAKAGPLVELLWDADAGVRMRAADALEKLSRTKPACLKSWKAELLGLLVETEQAEVLWHLELMLPRMELTAGQRGRVWQRLRELLSHPSSIVKTNAMQAMWELSEGNPALGAEIFAFLHAVTGCKAGQRLEIEAGPIRVTAAMRARARLLRATRSGDVV
jgi:hypothetical protein